MTTFLLPAPTDPRNNPSLAGILDSYSNYLNGMQTLSSYTKFYDIFIDGDSITYRARRRDIGDVVASDTDVGALINTLVTGGGVAVSLQTPGTYNSATPIVLPSNTALLGRGPGSVIKATGSWTAGSIATPGSYMVDFYNSATGTKWVVVQGLYLDCNDLAEGGIHMQGVASDSTQWNLVYGNFVANFRYCGIRIDDVSTSGGTRQHVVFNKIGPGTSSTPNRGIELRCNDIALDRNDIFNVTDVGLFIAQRGYTLDRSMGTWWFRDSHISVATYVAGGLSPDTQAVNVLCTASNSSGWLQRVYVDNIQRYGIYIKPDAGNKVSGLSVESCWFNGGSRLVDASGSDKAVALVLDANNVKSGDIYGVRFVGNAASTKYSKAHTTAGRWLAVVALKNGLTAGNNYVTVDGNNFKGCLNIWDPAGAKPDKVGTTNWTAPATNNQGLGTFSENTGLFTTLQNLLVNPTLLTDTDVDSVPDAWTQSGNLTPSYPGESAWQTVQNVITATLVQDVSCIAGQVYSVSADEKITVDAGGLEKAGLNMQFFDETGTQCVTGGSFSTLSAAGVAGAYANIAVNNKTAPADDGTYTGTVDTSSGTAAIVAKTGTFPNDTTSTFLIPGAGTAGADLTTTIATYTDATHVTLTAAPQATITDAEWFVYGHGDAIRVRVALKATGTAPVTIRWRNLVLAQAANTSGQTSPNATGTSNVTAGTAAIVAATGTFPNDLTRPIVVEGAGLNGTDLVTTISVFTDGTHVTLATAPLTTVTPAVWAMGWVIAHGLPAAPSLVELSPANSVARANDGYVPAVTSTSIYVFTPSCSSPSWYWRAKL